MEFLWNFYKWGAQKSLPFQGRRHGEAVTDEVGAGSSIYEALSTSSVACGDSFPS